MSQIRVFPTPRRTLETILAPINVSSSSFWERSLGLLIFNIRHCYPAWWCETRSRDDCPARQRLVGHSLGFVCHICHPHNEVWGAFISWDSTDWPEMPEARYHDSIDNFGAEPMSFLVDNK